MAASSEHGTARIKVQVVATLLPLNIPVHVDPFWAFIRFSESPTICDLENKIVLCLNCMGEAYPAELVVHDSPITPAWTYLPTSSTVLSSNPPHRIRFSESGISDTNVSEQLTVVLRPLAQKTSSGINKAKPQKPVLISYEISHHLPKSVRLIFKKQLVFMHESVLLSGSTSDILRDNDVVTINAICYFCFAKDDDGTPEGLSGRQVRATTEVEFESNILLKDLDADNLFNDTETQNRTDIEAKLSPEIRTKIDTLLKKLASLQHSNQNENSSNQCRKSKKRKTEDGDSRSESGNRFVAVSDRIDVQVEENRKTNRGDNDSELKKSFVVTPDKSKVHGEKEKKAQDQNSINDSNNADNLLSKSRKRKKKKSKNKMTSDVEVDSVMDTGVTQTTDAVSVMETCVTQTTDVVSVMETSVTQITDAVSVMDTGVTQATDAVSVMDTSVTQAIDAVNQTSQTSLYVNDKGKDLLQVDSAANMVVQSVPPTATRRRRRAATAADFGLSSLLCSLRKQQTNETNCKDSKEKSAIISQEVEKQRNDNTVPESVKTDVNFLNTYNQLNYVVPSPKRKRVRKRKKKNTNLDKSTSDKQISESIERNYTLKLPEHQKPQNNRVTFECDSDDDYDDGLSQTVTEETKEVSFVNHNEHPPTENGVTENTRQLSSQSEEENKSARSDVTKTSFAVAGAPINPDEKFQALLHHCGRTGRQFETINSANGHTVIRSSRKKQSAHMSAAGDAVHPDGDVLTNTSIITQHSSEAKTPTSNSRSRVQCSPSAVEDSSSNLSPHLKHRMLNTKNYNTSTPDLKTGQPLVEVTPLYMNYSSCQEMSGLPKEGDIIAYKILEMAEDYTPGLSNFKEAKVMEVEANTGSLLLKPRRGKDNKKRSGRFELSFNDNNDTVSTGEDELVAVNLTDLVDTRLVFRAEGRQ